MCTEIISLNSINQLIFVMDMCFLCGTDSVFNIQTSFGFRDLK